jgi:uncharacterized protein YpmB
MDPFDQAKADAIDKLSSDYDLNRADMLKTGAVEDRYTNFNEVNDRISSVMQVAGQDRLDK